MYETCRKTLVLPLFWKNTRAEGEGRKGESEGGVGREGREGREERGRD